MYMPEIETTESDSQNSKKAISEKDSDISTICSTVNRLTLAMERLTVHIPTSIRMHL